MSNTATVLAFDFGASSGRAIRAVYDGQNLNYEEIHRFDSLQRAVILSKLPSAMSLRVQIQLPPTAWIKGAAM